MVLPVWYFPRTSLCNLPTGCLVQPRVEHALVVWRVAAAAARCQVRLGEVLGRGIEDAIALQYKFLLQ